ncbi:unnamed protein product [Polarella glacialis]|uniref:SLC26A/SulP transporter domain-containing protein n=1 Tax=Polarella glacialis TaxID=89957 RepID=A0A813FHE2_POLGL|nr:unnamed protein product [Polarella glacialis]
MWTQLMGSIISLFVGQFVTTTNLDPLSAILFGQLSQRIVIHFQGPDAHLLLSNMMLVMPLMTICLGFGLYAVGRFRMAFMLRFFPYTVVAGFLAGSGILILVESLALASGPSIFKLMTDSVMLGLQSLQVEPALGREDSWQTFLELLSNWSQIGCAVLFSFLAGAVRDLHTFGTPCLLACCIGLSLAVEFMSGGTLPPKSWFLAFPEPVHWWEPFQVMGQALSGDFRPTMAIDAEFTATFVTIMTVAWSINTLAVAKLVPLRPGLKRCEEQDQGCQKKHLKRKTNNVGKATTNRQQNNH